MKRANSQLTRSTRRQCRARPNCAHFHSRTSMVHRPCTRLWPQSRWTQTLPFSSPSAVFLRAAMADSRGRRVGWGGVRCDHLEAWWAAKQWPLLQRSIQLPWHKWPLLPLRILQKAFKINIDHESSKEKWFFPQLCEPAACCPGMISNSRTGPDWAWQECSLRIWLISYRGSNYRCHR